MSAPLTITGFTYLSSLGSFTLGDSYVYREDNTRREVHVMISRQQQSLDSFIDAFEDALGSDQGGAQPDLILYAGLTDRDRPYLITNFLAAESGEDSAPQPAAHPDPQTPAQTDPQPASASGSSSAREPVDDATVFSDRGTVDDATRLSAPKRAPSPGSAPGDDATIVSPRVPRVSRPPRALPSAHVIEDPVHAPALIIDEAQRRYSPRTVPAQTATARPAPAWSLNSSAARSQPRSVREQEQRRARTILVAVGASILFSTVATIAAIAWLFTS